MSSQERAETESRRQIKLLQEMSASPYAPEPPARHLAVNFFMRINSLLRKSAETPHHCGGSDESKLKSEMESAPAFLAHVQKYLPLDIFRDKTVLDIGCGWGGKAIYYARELGLRFITGFDLPGSYRPEVSLKVAKDLGLADKCFFTNGYAEQALFPGQKFDIVLMDDVLEHVADPETTFAKAYDALSAGGYMIIKFPSIRMMYAHHLDRALLLPGLHYLMSFKTWASGLNHLRLEPRWNLKYTPFSETVKTKYHKCVTRNLNGLDYRNFKNIVDGYAFEIIALTCSPFFLSTKTRLLKKLYLFLWHLGFLKEFLSESIIFIGIKRSESTGLP